MNLVLVAFIGIPYGSQKSFSTFSFSCMADRLVENSIISSISIRICRYFNHPSPALALICRIKGFTYKINSGHDEEPLCLTPSLTATISSPSLFKGFFRLAIIVFNLLCPYPNHLLKLLFFWLQLLVRLASSVAFFAS